MLAGSESSKFRACGSNIYDPNNWGAFTVRYGFLSIANGGFVVDSQVPTNVDASPTGGDKYEVANYSAQRCNEIYGASDTVQPAGLYVQMLIRYA